MASLLRSLLRGVQRKSGNRTQMTSGAALGSQRAGMHQKAEHEYRRKQMAEALPPVEETPEEGLDMPASVEAEIPPAEEEDDAIVEEIATEEAEISADEEIVDDISEPQAEIEEETEEAAASLGARGKEQGARMAVDYSTERIPVLDYQVTGSVDPSTPLEYSSKDGSVKEIQEPLPGMAEAYGIPPYIPGVDEVISMPATDIEFTVDSQGDIIVS